MLHIPDDGSNSIIWALLGRILNRQQGLHLSADSRSVTFTKPHLPKPYFVRLRGLRQIREMSKQTPKQEPKEDTAGAANFRPVGLSISSFFYALSGVYYLVFPLVAADPSVWPLYVIGGASLLGSFGVFKLARWGLWLGLLLFPLQIVAPAFTLLTVLSYPGVWQQPIAIAFVASLFVLMFFASLTFLLVLDKRRSFN
jgi:hypothetical protein